MALSILDISHKWNRTICGPLLADFFSLAWSFQVHTFLMTKYYSALGIYPFLSSRRLMDIRAVHILGLLYIILLWNFRCQFLCEHMLSNLLGVYLGPESPSCMVTPCLTFWGTARLLPEPLHHFTSWKGIFMCLFNPLFPTPLYHI